MDFDTQVKLAVYAHFAETGRRPGPGGRVLGPPVGSLRKLGNRLILSKGVSALVREKVK